MKGPVIQWQLISTDPERSSKFYADAFGWQIHRDNALGYRSVDTGEGGVPGGIWPATPGAPSFVQLFLAVPDVDAAIERVLGLGGSVLVPKSVLPDGDEMAVLRDPVGTAFGVVKRS